MGQFSPHPSRIQGVIAEQLDAFRRDDGPAAFAFAAPSIQSQFGTPERFLDMVRRAYPPVHRPRAVEFSELLQRDGGIVQQVELVGPDGATQLALYTMERDGAGTLAHRRLLAGPQRAGRRLTQGTLP